MRIEDLNQVAGEFVAEEAWARNYHQVSYGEEYDVIYRATCADGDGNLYDVFWAFKDTKGSEMQADEYEWDNEENVLRIAPKINCVGEI